MRTVVLMRGPSTDQGTFGTLVTDRGTRLASGELPWRRNVPGFSSVPANMYLCRWLYSEKHGWCYHLTKVPGRSDVEMHSANWMGDRSLVNPNTGVFYKCELLGCIALGKKTGQLAQQKALLESKLAIEVFNAEMNREDFQLVIHDYQEPVPDVTGEISM